MIPFDYWIVAGIAVLVLLMWSVYPSKPKHTRIVEDSDVEGERWPHPAKPYIPEMYQATSATSGYPRMMDEQEMTSSPGGNPEVALTSEQYGFPEKATAAGFKPVDERIENPEVELKSQIDAPKPRKTPAKKKAVKKAAKKAPKKVAKKAVKKTAKKSTKK